MHRIYLAAESDLSFDEIRTRLSEALLAQFGRDEDGCPRFYLYETFPDYVIARGPNGALYRATYTLAGDDVTFGNAQEVETAYVAVAESCGFIALESEAAEEATTFPIAIIKPGWATGGLNGVAMPHYYTEDFCGQVAESAQGVPFGRIHPDQKGPDPTGANDAQRIAGYVTDGRLEGGIAKGNLTLFAAESELRSKLNQARQAKTLGVFGLSMLAHVAGQPGVIEGKQALVINKLVKLHSVDLCARAGAGGQFLAAASVMGGDLAAAQSAAVKPNSTAIAPQRPSPGTASASRSITMNKTLQKLLDSLRKKDAAKAGEFYSRAVLATEAEQLTIQDEVITALGETPAPVTAIASEASVAALNVLQRAQSRNRIENKLTESKLAEPARKLVRTHLEAVLVSEADLSDAKIDAEIAGTREAFASFENVGRPRIGSVVLDTRDKLALAMESMLGVKTAKAQGVAAFRGIRQAYVTITGDSDLSKLSGGGGFHGHLLASEAVSTADFPNILLDAMHKLLAQDYAENALDGLETVYESANLDDYRLRHVVRDGYFSELPVVAEGQPYLEMGKPTDEQNSYAPAKRGGILTISEETIRNDDLGAIARWPGKMSRAARNNLRSFIVNFFANNPVYGADGLTIFHAAHNNLGSNAFGYDGLVAAQLALRRQTEKDSGEFLGLPLRWIAVPPELEAAAQALNQTNTAGENSFFQRFGANNERIFVVERFTDTNDWYYGTDTSLAPFMEIGFLDGKQQPEIFLANQPTVGTQFSADQLQYKVKFVWGGTMTDYRGVGKNVNA
jgi:hypothetical protein